MPGCGRNLALDLRSVCETYAMQTHEESTALKTLPHASANWHGDCDPTPVIRVCSAANGGSKYRIAGARKSKREESIVRRLTAVIGLCLLTFPALCQSASKWQVAAITEVKPHPAAGEDASDPITYDISVKVANTIYLVRYTTPAGDIAPKYATGHELLVLVGKNTITYNDMLGRSYQVPIESQRPAAEPKQSK
jgi:hypothetical protein